MNNAKEHNANHKYLLWPIAVLSLLVIGVFVTTREVPKQQETRSHAQVNEPKNISEKPSQTPEEPTQPSQGSADTVFNISFSLSGIASQGGNVIPLHPKRDVALFFYDRDSNTTDQNIKPLYTVKTSTEFDNDPTSPTYTRFVHNNLSLTGVVPNGTYQIGLKTDQALTKMYKANVKSALGIPVAVGSHPAYDIAFGPLITGDIVPASQGDNAVDIADYNELMNCFGAQSETATCTAKTNADLDDNGIVDGIDYNIMLRSIKTLLVAENDVPITAVSPSPSSSPRPTTEVAPTKDAPTGMVKFEVYFVVTVIFLAGIIMLFRRTFPSFPLLRINEKVYFVSQSKTDEKGWFTLADDNKQLRGHYEGGEIKDGFARIHGKEKVKDGIKYLEVSKISWEN